MGAGTCKNGLILTWLQKPEKRFRANLQLRETHLFGWDKNVCPHVSINMLLEASLDGGCTDESSVGGCCVDRWMNGWKQLHDHRCFSYVCYVWSCRQMHSCQYSVYIAYVFLKNYVTVSSLFSFSMIGHISSTVHAANPRIPNADFIPIRRMSHASDNVGK